MLPSVAMLFLQVFGRMSRALMSRARLGSYFSRLKHADISLMLARYLEQTGVGDKAYLQLTLCKLGLF